MVYFGVNREHRSQVSVVGGQLEYDAPQCIIMQMRGKRRSRTEPSEHFNEMKTNSFVLYVGKLAKGKIGRKTLNFSAETEGLLPSSLNDMGRMEGEIIGRSCLARYQEQQVCKEINPPCGPGGFWKMRSFRGNERR